MDCMEAVCGEFLPPRRQFAGRDRIECRPRLVDRRMTGCKPTDRFAEVLLLSRDRQHHRASALQAQNACGIAIQELRPNLVLQWYVRQLAEYPLKRQSH